MQDEWSSQCYGGENQHQRCTTNEAPNTMANQHHEQALVFKKIRDDLCKKSTKIYISGKNYKNTKLIHSNPLNTWNKLERKLKNSYPSQAMTETPKEEEDLIRLLQYFEVETLQEYAKPYLLILFIILYKWEQYVTLKSGLKHKRPNCLKEIRWPRYKL